jgi:membrane protease YdiL (CAAX protease family)
LDNQQTCTDEAAAPLRPYGALSTSFLVVLFLLLDFVALLAAFIVAYLLSEYLPGVTVFKEISGIGDLLDGDFLALEMIFYLALVALFFVVLFSLPFKWLLPFRQYMAVKRPALKQVFSWLFITVALVVVLDSLIYRLGADVVPEWSRTIWQSADSKAVLLFAVIVLAPLSEEAVFRGFMFKGFEHRFGPLAAILVSAAVWSLLHCFQYGFIHVAYIMVLGIVMGAARWKSGSIFVPLIMHVMNNTMASLELVFQSSL